MAASGGEKARVFLALKAISQMEQDSKALILDEVDVGISGATADSVGKKLKALSKNQQLISISHLPQVAAYADKHFLVVKEQLDGQSISEIKALNDKEESSELARLLSGENITEMSLANAKELKKRASATNQL